MNSRSQGFHQFMSLILSLSIENHNSNMKNDLIIIDEPENHLHPSGIRNMMDELLKIGYENYVFVATHSCFMIDNRNKERNYIIKKDSKKNTIYKQILEDEDIYDDEVLADAFGINVYKDFLTPNKILVEGLSDKKILNKAIKKINPNFEVGITNGYGSNITPVASRFKLEDIKTFVILDDDLTGKSNKEKILKIGDIYNETNVMTIRDIENSIISGGTIEDTLGKNFISKILRNVWEEYFDEELEIDLDENKPFIEQIKIHLQKYKENENVDKFLEKIKTEVSSKFNPSNIETNFPKLQKLVLNILDKMQQ